MKKIILLSTAVLSVVGLIIAGIFAYRYFRSFNVIKENGLSFKYPKGLEIKREGEGNPDTGYITYIIATEFKHTYPINNESAIALQIPTKGRVKGQGLELILSKILEISDIKPENFITPVKEVNINGNKGEMVVYRLDKQWPDGPVTHAVFAEVYLNSKYTGAPVMLKYEEKDTELDSLDFAWAMILKTLKY